MKKKKEEERERTTSKSKEHFRGREGEANVGRSNGSGGKTTRTTWSTFSRTEGAS